jgi:hypothetical protein
LKAQVNLIDDQGVRHLVLLYFEKGEMEIGFGDFGGDITVEGTLVLVGRVDSRENLSEGGKA